LRPILLSLLITVAASAQPLFLQPEHPVAPPRIGLPSTRQTQPHIASNGTNHLVVWSDDRTSLPARGLPQLAFATRVDAQGNVLDSPNLVLPLRGYCLPFWNGTEYVVVSTDGYIRISRTGELLDAAPHPLVIPGDLFAITWTGQRLLVLTDQHYPLPQHAVLYDGSMNVIRGDFKLPVFTDRIASNGHGFLLTTGNIAVATDLDGNLTAKKDLSTPQYLKIYANYVASDGENYLLVENGYRAATVTPDLTMRYLGPEYFGHPTTNFPSSASVTWDGSHYQVVFVHYGSYLGNRDWIYEVRVELLDRDGASLNGDGTTLVNITGDDGPLVVADGLSDSRLMLWGVPASTFVTDGVWQGIAYSDLASAALRPFEFSRGALPDESPAVATAGDVSLVAWREPDASVRDRFVLFAARVDRNGRVLDAPIRLAGSTCDALAPAVSTDGQDFLVVWQLPASILAARIGRDGRRLETDPILVAVSPTADCGPSSPAVVSNGTNYLLTWQRKGIVNGARVSRGGPVLDPLPLVFATGIDQAAGVHAASDGHDYFVTWTDATIKQARGMRLTGGGTIVDTASIPLIVEKATAVYWSGRHYVTLAASADGVRAVRVTTAGERLDFAPGAPLGPAMAFPFDASTARVECGARGCFTYGLKDDVIVATRIDDAGSAVTSTSSPFARGDDAWRSLLVFGGESKNVAYERLAPETPYGDTWHLFLRSTGAGRGRAVR